MPPRPTSSFDPCQIPSPWLARSSSQTRNLLTNSHLQIDSISSPLHGRSWVARVRRRRQGERAADAGDGGGEFLAWHRRRQEPEDEEAGRRRRQAAEARAAPRHHQPHVRRRAAACSTGCELRECGGGGRGAAAAAGGAGCGCGEALAEEGVQIAARSYWLSAAKFFSSSCPAIRRFRLAAIAAGVL